MALEFPALRPGQTLVRYECTGTKHAQERGHVGISGGPSGIDILHTVDEAAVAAWVKNAESNNYHYISVVAMIRVEKTSDMATVISHAYWVLFRRDFPDDCARKVGRFVKCRCERSAQDTKRARKNEADFEGAELGSVRVGDSGSAAGTEDVKNIVNARNAKISGTFHVGDGGDDEKN